MSQLTPAEMLALTIALEMESNSLNVVKAGRMAVTDEQFKLQVEAGISAAETRIAGLQQFIVENNLLANSIGNQTQPSTEVM